MRYDAGFLDPEVIVNFVQVFINNVQILRYAYNRSYFKAVFDSK
jgi:hypothetical protein